MTAILSPSKYWLLPNASSHDYGIQGDLLIYWLHVVMIVLFIGWGAFMVYCLVRYRARPGGKALYEPIKAKASKYLEVGVVLIEGLVLIGISVPAWNQFKQDFPPEAESVRLRVVGHQFQWEFHYPGPDGEFGRTIPDAFDAGLNPLGLDESDPAAWDDIWSPGYFAIPNDTPIIAEISSLDVIHGFGIPQLRVKQDAVPGMNSPVWFHPAVEGEYWVVCSQLCGNSHYKMGARADVMPKAKYEAWLAEQEPFVAVEDRPQPTEGIVTPDDGGAHDSHEGHEGHDSHDSHDPGEETP